jgi:hypothetical protein
VEHVTYDASCAVLTTLPGTLPVFAALLKSGAAAPRPTLFDRLASRAAVLKRILPSRMDAGSASAAMPPASVETGCPSTSGTQSCLRTHGGDVPQSASVVQVPPPGWLQKPMPGGQSLLLPHASVGCAAQRRLAGMPAGSRGAALATGTTFRAR